MGFYALSQFQALVPQANVWMLLPARIVLHQTPITLLSICMCEIIPGIVVQNVC